MKERDQGKIVAVAAVAANAAVAAVAAVAVVVVVAAAVANALMGFASESKLSHSLRSPDFHSFSTWTLEESDRK